MHVNGHLSDFCSHGHRFFSQSFYIYPDGNYKSIHGMPHPVLRMMDPEYVSPTCLACHGGPRGKFNITGMKMDGWKEGDLAGAVSIVLPLK